MSSPDEIAIERLSPPPIEDDADLASAIKTIDHMLDEDLDADGQAYLEALGDLVEAYESEHYPEAIISDADMLQHLLEARGVDAATMAAELGIGPRVIAGVLECRRRLTAGQVATLAGYFHVDEGVFAPRGEPAGPD
jgi:HTH-type transcriptional regulator / antitoxin HigA